MSGTNDFRIQVLLSFQRALWDMVTPALRGVAVQPTSPLIEARFIYDHEPTFDESQIVAEVETYVASDFLPGVDVAFSAEGIPTPSSRDLLPGEEWVYLRREGSVEDDVHG
jgi:hypothetical protein